MLEEGLAVWFQDDPSYHAHHQSIQARSAFYGSKNPADRSYAMARNLVRGCMPELAHAIKDVRSGDTKLRDITAEHLAPRLPGIDNRTIDAPCAPFPYGIRLPGKLPPPMSGPS